LPIVAWDQVFKEKRERMEEDTRLRVRPSTAETRVIGERL